MGKACRWPRRMLDGAWIDSYFFNITRVPTRNDAITDGHNKVTGSAHVRTRSQEFSDALIEGRSRANRRTDTRATANFLRHYGRELREANQPQQTTHWLQLQASRMCAIGDAVCLTKLARG